MKPRVFARNQVTVMSAECFQALNDASTHGTQWDQHADALVFWIDEVTWLILVLKYPELKDLQ
jgi:hypothetical protein